MEEHILSPRVVLQELGHIIHLAADDDPAVLPGGVERDLGRGEELLGLPRHGWQPTDTILALGQTPLLDCLVFTGGCEGERYQGTEEGVKTWS